MTSKIYKAIQLKKSGLKIALIAKRLGVSERTINRCTKGMPHPNNPKFRNLPKTAGGLNIKKAEILGYLASEGCQYIRVENRWEFHKQRNKRYWRSRKKVIIEFSNTNKLLVKRFQSLMNDVYGYIPKFYYNGNIRIRWKKIIRDLTSYTNFGSHNWIVPKEILESKDNLIKARFCRAFFDGDGTIDLNKKEIRIDSKNIIGLKQLGSLLDDINISYRFHVFSDRSRIVVKSRHQFYSIVGTLHPEKLEKMKNICK